MERNRGIIKFIILVIIAVLILSYFRIDLRQFFASETVKNNFNYVSGIVVDLWHKYLEAPASYVWNKIVVDIIWVNFNQIVDRLGRNLTPNLTIPQ